ncbi:hypothetical protein EDC04DRAFT_2614487 [Pisolithus marmoratus]|nr:hypothetical protein EDC04DRAFT_2614487 [Pisolithus marmoratus]
MTTAVNMSTTDPVVPWPSSPGHLTQKAKNIMYGTCHFFKKEEYATCHRVLRMLLLKSLAESTPFSSSIIQTGIQYIKYGPNYTRGNKDKEMAEVDEDDKDKDLDDQYSDDKDASYKIQHAAMKLLAAIMVTQPELFVPLYKEVSLVLIS